jgi:hypothetical protein
MCGEVCIKYTYSILRMRANPQAVAASRGREKAARRRLATVDAAPVRVTS